MVRFNMLITPRIPGTLHLHQSLHANTRKSCNTPLPSISRPISTSKPPFRCTAPARSRLECSRSSPPLFRLLRVQTTNEAAAEIQTAARPLRTTRPQSNFLRPTRCQPPRARPPPSRSGRRHTHRASRSQSTERSARPRSLSTPICTHAFEEVGARRRLASSIARKSSLPSVKVECRRPDAQRLPVRRCGGAFLLPRLASTQRRTSIGSVGAEKRHTDLEEPGQ